MVSILARLPAPPLMAVNGRQPVLGTLQRFSLPAMKETGVLNCCSDFFAGVNRSIYRHEFPIRKEENSRRASAGK
ncbi:hypothetical protein CASFOL_007355 [Castilleja foliolosa]|uniref:Uncharacterized protein n=1 Tax=Castilleja foliolosa TaxID=1961234 RepID=A0ABD3E9J0_9LAMI